MMSEEALISLINYVSEIKSETNNIECKLAAVDCPKKLHDTLSSFSNQSGGGTIIFGIDEKNGFLPEGVYNAADLQKKVSAQCKEMQPHVRALFTVCNYKGKIIVSAEIPEIDISEKPCYYKGRGKMTGSYIRVGDSDEHMTDYEIYSYEAFRNKYQDDIRIIKNADMNDIDGSAINDYLYRIRAKKSRLSSMENKEILRISGIEKNNELTLAGAMIFSKYPQMYFPRLCVTAAVVPGYEVGSVDSENTRFINNQRISGTIPQMLEDTMFFISRSIATRTKIDPGTGKRQDITEYPLEAVREIVLNALVHRDYSVHTEGMPIQVIIYKNRMEVINPGGLYGRIKIDQLGTVQPDTRNPIISTLLEDIGITENRYSGIPTIRRVMREAGLPEPVFEDIRGSFKVTLFNGCNTKSAGSLAEFCETPRTRKEIMEFIGAKNNYYSFTKKVKPLIDSGQLALTIPDKPKSKNQKYIAVK